MTLVNANADSALQQAFGPAQWRTYFGDVGEAPPLPAGLNEILQSPCPFMPGKRIRETHKLFLVPRTLDGRPVSLDLIGEIIERPLRGHPARYLYFSSYVKADIGAKSVPEAHWCLMTRDVVPGSVGMDYVDQCAFMETQQARIGVRYDIPTTFEAALCILLQHVETGERLFARDDARRAWTMTRCSDEVSAQMWAVAVGGFEPKGLLLYRSPDFLFDRYFAGTAGVRRF